ncbi:MAG: rhodanese-like domain-containing protein [Campylobacterales bacterium]|nr:rhodanese-like domain-containing protein [Campylobacterales bacterium]
MKKILIILFLFINTAFAEVLNTYASQELLDSKITIIDIRTPGEWRETGLLAGAVPITFFDERGGHNVPLFLEELSKHVKPGEPFAIICHVGSRTSAIAEFLAENQKAKVINLLGGMDYAQKSGLKILSYKVR